MKISIKRDDKFDEFKIPFKSVTLLKALFHIKQYQDNSLSFGSNCRSGVCGECSLRVNGKEVLACSYKVKDGDKIKPLRHHKVQRDLLIDREEKSDTLKRAEAYLHKYQKSNITPKDIEKNQIQSDCILCNSCYSACPVLEVNPNFLAPFALSRAYRYSIDKKEANSKSIIDNIQNSGVWDCTLCGECTMVCPQGIDPKTDILMLRSISTQFGYSDPNFQNISFGFESF